MKRRRQIHQWHQQAVARRDYDCTKCDTRISSTSLYERDVFASPRALETERVHISPPCARSYYTGK